MAVDPTKYDREWKPTEAEDALMGDIVEHLIIALEDCPPWMIKEIADILFVEDYHGYDGLVRDLTEDMPNDG